MPLVGVPAVVAHARTADGVKPKVLPDAEEPVELHHSLGPDRHHTARPAVAADGEAAVALPRTEAAVDTAGVARTVVLAAEAAHNAAGHTAVVAAERVAHSFAVAGPQEEYQPAACELVPGVGFGSVVAVPPVEAAHSVAHEQELGHSGLGAVRSTDLDTDFDRRRRCYRLATRSGAPLVRLVATS